MSLSILGVIAPSFAAQPGANMRSSVVGLNVIGVDILTRGGEQATKYLDLLEGTGASWVRTSAIWANIERRPGKFDWTKLDAIVNALRSRNIRILMTVGHTPCWAREDLTMPCFSSTTSEHHDGSQIPRKDHWQQFLTTIAQHYKGRVWNFDIWNEPNLAAAVYVPGAADNSDLLLQTYRDKILIPAADALHAASQPVRVAGPVIGAFGAMTPELFAHLVEVSMGNGAAQGIDIVSVHLYPPRHNLLDYGRALRVKMRSLGIGQKLLWLTEFGTPLGSGDNVLKQVLSGDREKAQADYLSTALMQNEAQGHVFNRMFWYAFGDTDIFKPTITDKQRFGLINNDLTERPAYKALKSYTSSPRH